MGEQTTKPAAIVPPKTAGECLTLKQLYDLSIGTILVTIPEPFLGKRKVEKWYFRKDSERIENMQDVIDASGRLGTAHESPHQLGMAIKMWQMSWNLESTYRLATKREIKQAYRAYEKAWEDFITRIEKEASSGKLSLAEMRRKHFLDIAPPPREPTK